MEGQAFRCSCCLYTFKESDGIDLKSKRATCPRCDSLVTFSRKEINSSKVVTHDIENALRFFEEKNYENAKKAADSAISVSDDNVIALFIIAYYEAYCTRHKTGIHLDKFFKSQLQEIDTLEEEIEGLKKLISLCGNHLDDYEEYILSKMLQTQGDEDLQKFVEDYCPAVIMRRGNIDWFTPSMRATYKEITAKVSVYNTWKALYQQISKNPDSPELNDKFFLKTKTERFYNDYILGVEDIFAGITDDAMKNKFMTAVANKKQIFKQKM